MKYFKTISTTVFFLLITNIVSAGNQRTVANVNVNLEVRSIEDRVGDSSIFTSINPDSNAAEMTSVSADTKNNMVTTISIGLVQAQENNKDITKKYNRFSDNQGEKKNK